MSMEHNAIIILAAIYFWGTLLALVAIHYYRKYVA